MTTKFFNLLAPPYIISPQQRHCIVCNHYRQLGMPFENIGRGYDTFPWSPEGYSIVPLLILPMERLCKADNFYAVLIFAVTMIFS